MWAGEQSSGQMITGKIGPQSSGFTGNRSHFLPTEPSSAQFSAQKNMQDRKLRKKRTNQRGFLRLSKLQLKKRNQRAECRDGPTGGKPIEVQSEGDALILQRLGTQREPGVHAAHAAVAQNEPTGPFWPPRSCWGDPGVVSGRTPVGLWLRTRF